MLSVENTDYKKKGAFLILCFYTGVNMKTKKRQKMCYNCEGEIDLDVIVCPFCAADLRAEKPEQQIPSYNQAGILKNLNTQQSLYPSQNSPKIRMEDAGEEDPLLVPSVEEEASKNMIVPTLLMTLGAQLLLFGFLMLLFSSKGVMILKWDARLWYFYVLGSIPFLIFGYKSLNKL
jgi:hypothetical protein